MSKRAILLSGGKGTRLKPYTVSLPKPLVPIGDFPIAEILVKQLASQGFDHITMAVNHQADLLMAYFGDGSKWGIRIDYSLETVPLGTMGPLSLIQGLPENFLILNGDVLTDMNFDFLFETHMKEKSHFTISSSSHKVSVDFGVLQLRNGQKLLALQEKPSLEFNVSMGVYVANKEILKYIPFGEPLGFDELVAKLIYDEVEVSVEPFHGFWLDIGRPADYEKASELVVNRELNFFPFNN